MSKDPRISIVDDVCSIRDVTMGFIRTMSSAVQVFESAHDSLKSGRLPRTSCLTAEMRMPGMAALELQIHLVAAGAPVPTMPITTFPMNGTGSAQTTSAIAWAPTSTRSQSTHRHAHSRAIIATDRCVSTVIKVRRCRTIPTVQDLGQRFGSQRCAFADPGRCSALGSSR
jgi:CheY-like chemotaxis protein